MNTSVCRQQRGETESSAPCLPPVLSTTAPHLSALGFLHPAPNWAWNGIVAVPHGFRSSFRDWAERTNHPREVVEAALAHAVRNQTEAAYARSDMFERRRTLMEDWGAYLEEVRGQVVRLRHR